MLYRSPSSRCFPGPTKLTKSPYHAPKYYQRRSIRTTVSSERLIDCGSVASSTKASNLQIKTLEEIQPIQIKCFQSNCSDVVFYICKCSAEGVLSCETHIGQHRNKDKFKDHSTSLFNQVLNNETRDRLANFLYHWNEQIRDLKKKISSEINEYMAKVQKETDNLLLNMTRQMEKNNKKIKDILSDSPKTYDHFEGLKHFMDSNFRSGFTQSRKEFPISNELWRIIGNEVNNWHEKNLGISKSNPFPLAKDQNIATNEISFFRDKSTEFVTWNLMSFKTQIKNIRYQKPNSDYMSSALSICLLPNNSKFCYGNDSGLAFIIDQENKITMLENGLKNGHLGTLYYENSVYAIGGSLNSAAKYNLTTNKWEKLPSLPYDGDFNCSRSALLGDIIVIVGMWLSEVITYDICNSKYSELGLTVSPMVHKFIFSAAYRVYIGECKKNVYECAENDLNTWNCIASSNQVVDIQNSYFTSINDSVYFLMTYKLYEFKLNTKSFKLIGEYNKNND